MKEATGGGGAEWKKGWEGGVWICLLYCLIPASSHTNTICHHSDWMSAASAGLLGTDGYWWAEKGAGKVGGGGPYTA